MVMYLLHLKVPMYGVISIVGLKYYEPLIPYGLTGTLIAYFIVALGLLKYRKIECSFSTVRIDEASRVILVMAAIVIAALAWPRVFMVSNRRFNAIPGMSWGAIYSVLSILLLLTHVSFRYLSSILHICLLVFIMGRGERADQLMVLGMYIVFVGSEIRKERTVNIKLIIGGLVLFLCMTAIGAIRVVGIDNFIKHFDHYLSIAFYSQQTAQDVTHVYLTSVWHYFNKPLFLEAFLNTPSSIIPGIPTGGTSSEYNYIQHLREFIPSAGGGLFYSEGAMNFGVFGVAIYSIMFLLLLRYTIQGKSLLSGVLLLSIFTLIFRAHWYGLLFLVKPVFYSYFLILMLKSLTKKLRMVDSDKPMSG